MHGLSRRRVRVIEENNALLRSFVATSRDALRWNETIGPVDLSAPESVVNRGDLYYGPAVFSPDIPALRAQAGRNAK
jgi:hypothetical protein